MIKNIFFQIFSMLYFATFGQQLQLDKIGYIPDVAEECSGIALLPSGHLAMINDSGNDPEVFITTTDGDLIKSIYLPDACNIDWEAAVYHNGHLYIGDFGNNDNERKDLVVLKYKITPSDSIYNQQIIKFRYANQREFPPDRDKQNFDTEAMIHYRDSIFVFTKNRTRPFSGYTYVYGMPDVPDSYILAPLDSFRTGVGEKDYWWITDAALSPDGKKLVLLGYDKLWLFEDFKGTEFFSGISQVYALGWLSQKESITFFTDSELLITDELNRFGGGKIYHTQLDPPDEFEVKVGPKEFQSFVKIELTAKAESKVRYEVFNTKGKRIDAGTLPDNTTDHKIDTRAYPPGGYVFSILLGEKPFQAFKLKKLYTKSDT